MDKNMYYRTVSVIFGALAIAHAARVYYGWEAQVGEYVIPVWFSWVAVVVAGYLAVRGWQLADRKKRR
jgi:hypothetical protein